MKEIIIDERLASEYLPKRDNHGHKGNFGKGLLIGGSLKMAGAIALAAEACLHSGIGTLSLFVPRCLNDLSKRIFEAMYIFADSDEQGFFDTSAIKQLQEIINDYDYIAIGNGMGRSKVTVELVQVCLKSDKPLVIDADGIWCLKDQLDLLRRPHTTIITPHIKEFSYLTKLDVQTILSYEQKYLNDFLNTYPNTLVILKSHQTYIQDFENRYLLNKPNSALAKGGSGDVLCGIILALIAQSKGEYTKACVCASYVHAACANPIYDPNYFTPSQMIEELNVVYKHLRNQNNSKAL